MAGRWEGLAEAAQGVAASARAEARFTDERRVALTRSALVWWQGEAAEAYQRRVQERINGLAALAVELDAVAAVADRLAAAALVRAATDDAFAPGGPG